MLDIRGIRENPQKIKERLCSRNKNYDSLIDEILSLDIKRREILNSSEKLKSEQNKISAEISKLKKEGKENLSAVSEMRELSLLIKELSAESEEINKKQMALSLAVPNIPHKTVPIGVDSSDNEVVDAWGEVKDFPYPPKAHWEIGEDLNILDFQRAQKVTDTRFTFYRGAGARLERSLINYFLNTHVENGYTEMIPPFMVNEASMLGTGQLPKFSEDMYKICNEDYFLIPTAEVPVTNFHRDEILDGSRLPLKYCAYSPCFRNESHAAGRDTRGLIRQHQFNKVELVRFSTPQDSYNQLEKVLQDAERVLKGLELPFRVVKLCTGDLGFAASKTYDIEVFMPSYNRYVEISSCSNYEDFQARRMNSKYKNQKGEKAQLLHTVNGSGVAIGRALAAVLENYQNDDGTVTVPKALIPFMGCDRIGKSHE